MRDTRNAGFVELRLEFVKQFGLTGAGGDVELPSPLTEQIIPVTTTTAVSPLILIEPAAKLCAETDCWEINVSRTLNSVLLAGSTKLAAALSFSENTSLVYATAIAPGCPEL